MDGVTLIVLAIGLCVILAVVLMAHRTRPFRGTRRSGKDHETGAWAWIGADDRHTGHSDHGGDNGDGGDGGGGGGD